MYLTESIPEVVLAPDKSSSQRFSVMLGRVVTNTLPYPTERNETHAKALQCPPGYED